MRLETLLLDAGISVHLPRDVLSDYHLLALITYSTPRVHIFGLVEAVAKRAGCSRATLRVVCSTLCMLLHSL